MFSMRFSSRFYINLESKVEMANQQNRYCSNRNIGNTRHHELQDTIRTAHLTSPSFGDKCREENEHHQQQHGPLVQIMVCVSKTQGPDKTFTNNITILFSLTLTWTQINIYRWICKVINYDIQKWKWYDKK